MRGLAAVGLAVMMASCGGGNGAPPETRTVRGGAHYDPARVERDGPREAVDEAVGVEATGSASPLAAEYEGAAALDGFEGRASYYSDRLEGRSTASGEPYSPEAYTAANRDLPFGTVLRVIRAETGATTYVRVNDRGPFGDRSRVVDLSRAAAEELDMIRAGVVDVRVEILSRP